MKRIIGLLTVTLLLAGCTGNNGIINTDNTDNGKTSKAPEETEEKTEDVIEEISIITEDDVFTEGSTEQLVNPAYPLPETYEPEDLEYIDLLSTQDTYLRSEANVALRELFEAASDEGLELYAVSGYRSYVTQEGLYNNYVNQHGQEEADRFSAKPGTSEHQTGLVMDVSSESAYFGLSESFEETPEGEFVKNNAHKYGFIVRYLDGKEDITGYMYEPWHIRYLGKELAQDVYDSGLTYEEYIESNDISITPVSDVE